MSRFSKQAELYARYRPDYPPAMYDFIFDHLSRRQTAWDCATGSGQVAKYLDDHFEKVIATDISKEQLSYAPKKGNIEYRNVPAEDSGLPANYFDLITVAQAIHWFDFGKFYREVRRVAKRDALLAVIGYGMVRVRQDVNPIIDGLYEEAFTTYFSNSRMFLDNNYETIPFPFDEISSPDFSNTFRWTLAELQGYFNSWSAIQKIKSERGYNPANETIAKLKKKLPRDQKLQVTFPMFLRLGKVGKH